MAGIKEYEFVTAQTNLRQRVEQAQQSSSLDSELGGLFELKDQFLEEVEPYRLHVSAPEDLVKLNVAADGVIDAKVMDGVYERIPLHFLMRIALLEFDIASKFPNFFDEFEKNPPIIFIADEDEVRYSPRKNGVLKVFTAAGDEIGTTNDMFEQFPYKFSNIVSDVLFASTVTGTSVPDYLAVAVAHQLQKNPTAAMFVHQLGQPVDLLGAYREVKPKYPYLTLEQQLSRNLRGIPKSHHDLVRDAIAYEKDALRSQRGSHVLSRNAPTTNVPFTYLFEGKEEPLIRDIPVRARNTFAHQFGKSIDYTQFRKP